MKRAVLYARVSGDDTKGGGLNLKGQLAMCQDYARSHGWQIVTELAEDERGAKGSSFELPQLNHALDMARAGEFDILVTRELDRFARGLAKQLIVEGEFKQKGVQVEYVLGDYPDTPEGQLNKQIRAVIAEFEREKIKERMLRGRLREVKRGSIIAHGKAVYGYVLIHDGDKYLLEIDETRAAIVRMIFDWYTGKDGERLGVFDILRKLNELKVPTPQRSKKWSKSTIHFILRNETYIGRWHYGKKGRKGNLESLPMVHVPAIINMVTWGAAQEQRKHNKKFSRRNRKNEYLFAQRAKCGACGGAMAATSTHNGKKLYLYYRCPVPCTLGYVRQCSQSTNFRADEVDAVVWAEVKAFITNPAKLKKGINLYLEEREKVNAPLRERLNVVDSLLADNQKLLTRLLDLYLSGEFAKEMLVDRKKRLENTIEALEKERGSLFGQLEQTLTEAQIQGLQDFAGQISEGIKGADKNFEARQRIIEYLGVEITLAIENEEKIAYLHCEFSLSPFLIVSNNTRSAEQQI